jgi:hypothetical protein
LSLFWFCLNRLKSLQKEICTREKKNESLLSLFQCRYTLICLKNIKKKIYSLVEVAVWEDGDIDDNCLCKESLGLIEYRIKKYILYLKNENYFCKVFDVQR